MTPSHRITRPGIGLLAALLALSFAAIAAGGAASGAKSGPKNQWATVNICDTKKHPDQLGIRARMPGDGRKEVMWMRFIAQYRKNGVWVRAKGAISPWRKAGSARYTYQETGWTFAFDKLLPGEGYTMRGKVLLEWRKSGKVLRSTHVNTSSSHPTGYGDPANYSAATCFLSGTL